MSEQTRNSPPGALGMGRTGAATDPLGPNGLQDLVRRVEELAAGTGRLEARLTEAEAECRDLRAEIARLDGDLDESRRLNLRAAELLDVVYDQLGNQPPRNGAEERGTGT